MDIIYYFFLLPIETMLKLVLEFVYKYTANYGLSIILLSIIVNIVLTPIYSITEKWREEDKKKKKQMKDMLNKISQNYKGKEKFFYTQAYYKTQNYNPLTSIKASTGLLIQIPFFFAAFLFLSNYEALESVNFGIIQDLSKPDQLLFKLNLLPFLMTAINLFAAYYYVEKFDDNEKFQFIGISLLFLFLLYSQPAGMLLYWTFNNLFYLIRNFLRRKKSISSNLDKKNFDNNQEARIKNQLGLNNIFIIKILNNSLIVLIFLSLISFIATKVLPSGISLDFNKQSIKYYLFCSISVLLILLIIRKDKLFSFISFNKQFEKIAIIDVILLLLPMAIIIQYTIFNLDLMNNEDIILFIFKSLFISIIFIILFPFIFSIFFEKKLICAVSTAYLLLLFYMPILASTHNWSFRGSLTILFTILFFTTVILYILYSNNKKFLSIITSIFFIFTILNSFYINFDEIKKEKITSKKSYHSSDNHKYILDAITRSSIEIKHDIIFLVYESYVNQETMSHYGIDNSKQISFLKEKNFKIYEKNYTLGSATYSSLSRTLNLSNEIGNFKVKNYTAGSNFLSDILSKNGYKTYGVVQSKKTFRGEMIPVWDEYFPDTNILPFDLFKGVSEGIFRYDFEVGTKVKNLGIEYRNKKREIFAKKENSPYFMFTQSAHPGHSQNSGKCLPKDKQSYKDQLKFSNNEMKEDINIILEENPTAIIIVAGDHGPYLTLNCYTIPEDYDASKITRYHIQDRFGSFLAIHWPKDLKYSNYDIKILQDVFPAVLARLFNDEDIWDKGRVSSRTPVFRSNTDKEISVENGIIKGGKNDGEPLFLGSMNNF
jgi:YidC/Oxa1 family membrane protein insertase